MGLFDDVRLPYNVIAFHGWTQWDGPMLLTPYGRLVSEPDGSYSLFGTVIVPGNGLLIRQLNYSTPSGLTLPATFFSGLDSSRRPRAICR
jgi:hypothetical protein